MVGVVGTLSLRGVVAVLFPELVGLRSMMESVIFDSDMVVPFASTGRRIREEVRSAITWV